jgi:hypothetical protein
VTLPFLCLVLGVVLCLVLCLVLGVVLCLVLCPAG